MSSSLVGRLLTFRSVHDTLGAESRFRKAGLAFETIPTPRAISSACGYCLFLGLEESGPQTRRPGNPELLAGIDVEARYKVFEIEVPALRKRERRYEREDLQD